MRSEALVLSHRAPLVSEVNMTTAIGNSNQSKSMRDRSTELSESQPTGFLSLLGAADVVSQILPKIVDRAARDPNFPQVADCGTRAHSKLSTQQSILWKTLTSSFRDRHGSCG